MIAAVRVRRAFGDSLGRFPAGRGALAALAGAFGFVFAFAAARDGFDAGFLEVGFLAGIEAGYAEEGGRGRGIFGHEGWASIGGAVLWASLRFWPRSGGLPIIPTDELGRAGEHVLPRDGGRWARPHLECSRNV